MLFHGIHDHTLDAKNRLTIPARSRAPLGDGVTLAIGFENCLQVWPAADYAALVKQALSNLNPFSEQARELKRFFFANAITMDLDSAGRIPVTPEFAANAQIGKDVKVVGTGECLELWDPGVWAEHNAALRSRAAEHIASLGNPA